MKEKIKIKTAALMAVLMILCSCSANHSGLLTGEEEIGVSVPEESSDIETEGSQNEETEEKDPVEEEQSEEKLPINRIAGNEAEIDAVMDRIFKQFSVVGGSVAVFEKGEVVYLHHFGRSNIEKGLSVSDETRFRIASVSKAVTALLAEILVDEGKLSLDRDLSEFVHEKLRSPAYPNVPVTARQLMTHTSSLIDGESYQVAISTIPFVSLDQILAEGKVWSGKKPGEKYVYTNFGMGLLSGVIESVTGERFYEYADKTLFKPLEMDAGYVVEKVADKSQIASMYGSKGLTAAPSVWKAMGQDYVNVPIGQMYLLGQGELYISAYDLARIGCILAGDGCINGTRIISEERLDEMHQVYFTDEKSGMMRGLGVQAFDGLKEEGYLWGHQGNAYGMISGLIYDREEEYGFVVLTNSCYAARANNVYEINRAVVKEFRKYFRSDEG